MHLKIYKHKIDWYCSISNLQEIVYALTNYSHWNDYILLTQKGKEYYKILNLYLSKTDEDKIYSTDDKCVIYISEDSLGLLESCTNILDENINSYSYELNDLFYDKENEWVGFYLYIDRTRPK